MEEPSLDAAEAAEEEATEQEVAEPESPSTEPQSPGPKKRISFDPLNNNNAPRKASLTKRGIMPTTDEGNSLDELDAQELAQQANTLQRKRSIVSHLIMRKQSSVRKSMGGDETTALGRLLKPRKSLIERLAAAAMAAAASHNENYSEEKLVARAELRQEPAVLQVLELWWGAAQAGSLADGEEAKDTELLQYTQYVLMSKKIYRALVEEYDEEDAQSQADEDWVRDRRGRDDGLTKTFFQARR
eukprot:2251783-Prymnesium_polylepis.1